MIITQTRPAIPLSNKAKNITGTRFGSLVALQPVAIDPTRLIVWEYQCDCGNLYESGGAWVTAQLKNATNPKAPSCGCLNKETTRELRLTHGMSKHPLFWVWSQMVERCHNPDNINYHKYGAKGVYVCDAWRKSSTEFMNWALTNGWEKGLHLDKDILSHTLEHPLCYSPETCQFISISENSRSTKKWLIKNKLLM